MKNILGRNFRKTNLIIFLLFFFIIGLLLPSSYGEEILKNRFGFSILEGTNANREPHMKEAGFLPRLIFGINENWDFEFEGNFSYYGISKEKNIYFLGLDGNIMFKSLKWRGGNIFLLAGGGIGYDNNNGKIKEIGDSHFAGLLQAGTGINLSLGKGLWLRGEYRFQHISEPFRRDSGLNTHNVLLGISF